MAKQKKFDPGSFMKLLKPTRPRRDRLDIGVLRRALQSAESVSYPRRARLYEIYEQVVLDGHLSTVRAKRKLGITNAEIAFQRKGKDGQETEDLAEFIRMPYFFELLEIITDTPDWGHSLVEFDFRDLRNPSVELIPRKHVSPERGLVLLSPNDTEGIDFRSGPYPDHTIEIGQRNNFGRLLIGAQYVIYKRNGLADYATYVELFGMPYKIGKYPGHDTRVQEQLNTALGQSGGSSHIVIPEEAHIDVLASQSGGETHTPLIELCNRELSKIWLGQTMTTEDGSSLSQAQVHQAVEENFNTRDRLWITYLLNDKFLPLLIKHGFPVEGGQFFFPEVERIPKEKRLEMDLQLARTVDIPGDYFYKTYGVPPPEAGPTDIARGTNPVPGPTPPADPKKKA